MSSVERSRCISPVRLATAAQLACSLEASAPKPGNVNRYHDFEDAGLEDFIVSGAAIASELAAAEHSGVGDLVLRCVRSTRRWVPTNTNLGIILMFAPLARAAARDGLPLRSALSRVLANLTVSDAEAVYAAIRLARPGGLGEAREQDVSTSPTVDLRAAMALAADRDALAREYVTDFAVTFEIAVPALREAREQGADWSLATVECYLRVLASLPDSLIERKRGRETAESVSRAAAQVLATGAPNSPERREALVHFDRELRGAGHSLNPGTTADLTAAALFVSLLEVPPSCAGEGE